MAESKGGDGGVKLSAKWQFDAAMLSRPVDLSTLVSMSQSHPQNFLQDDTMHRMVAKLLNSANPSIADKDTRLDILTILANVAATTLPGAREEVRVVLQGVSEWFEEYLTKEEGKHDEEQDDVQDPELHKAMLLLLSRAYDYKLKTEDLLELTGGDRRLALETVVGLLEEGETYSTELKQRQKPSTGKVAQWEHELVCHRYEKPLILQLCRLVRGFTHPGTYFGIKRDDSSELELYSVDQFSAEMDGLLNISLKSRIVEKLSIALYDCLFADLEEEEEYGEAAGYRILLDETDHIAIASVHTFLQNLYFYATRNTENYRQHMLSDTLLVPRLILPYLDRCVFHANLLSQRSEKYSRALSSEGGVDGGSTDPADVEAVAALALDHPALVQGIAASLRTLIIASFRAPPTRFVLGLLRRLNPTASMLRAAPFCARHSYIFALLCMLNVNMGALDLSRSFLQNNSVVEAYYAHTLLHEMAAVLQLMDEEAQRSVLKRVVQSGALPLSRDTPSYAAVMSVLHGGDAGQFDYLVGLGGGEGKDEEEDITDARAAAKQEAAERLQEFKRKASVVDAKGGGSGGDTKQEQEVPGTSYRLLGALPDLDRNPETKDMTMVALDLELPEEGPKRRRNNLNIAPQAQAEEKSAPQPAARAQGADPDIPGEFTCSINGHLMKEPVRSPHGHVFEKSTIELWLKTRGSVCPITHNTLTIEDLTPDEELQTKIMRWHIQKTSFIQMATSEQDDDIYDF